MDSYRSTERCRRLIELVRSKLDRRIDTEQWASGISMVARSLLTVSFSRRIRDIIVRNVYISEQTENCRAHTLPPGSVNIALRIRPPRYNYEEDGPASGN